MTRVQDLGRHDAWDGVRAVVVGLDPSGFAVADNLVHQGADVLVLEEADPADDADERARTERATLLEILGARVQRGPSGTTPLPERTDLVVVSATCPSSATQPAQARRRGIEVWGDVELAWRLRDPQDAAPWLVVAGAPGRSTTGHLLDHVLRAHGLRTSLCGDTGLPAVEAVMDPSPRDALVVMVTAPQLRLVQSLAAESAVVLGARELPGGYESHEDYLSDEGRVYEHVERACVYNVADPLTEQLVRDADVQEGARAIGFTLEPPAVGMVGVVDGILADRAFIEERRTSAAELGSVEDLASSAPHFVSAALAAAALGRAHGVPPVAVRNGLRAYEPPGEGRTDG